MCVCACSLNIYIFGCIYIIYIYTYKYVCIYNKNVCTCINIYIHMYMQTNYIYIYVCVCDVGFLDLFLFIRCELCIGVQLHLPHRSTQVSFAVRVGAMRFQKRRGYAILHTHAHPNQMLEICT